MRSRGRMCWLGLQKCYVDTLKNFVHCSLLRFLPEPCCPLPWRLFHLSASHPIACRAAQPAAGLETSLRSPLLLIWSFRFELLWLVVASKRVRELGHSLCECRPEATCSSPANQGPPSPALPELSQSKPLRLKMLGSF